MNSVSRFISRAAILLALAALMSLRPCHASTPALAPPVYQDLYNSLQTYLEAFNATLSLGGSRYSGLWAGNLTRANGNVGPQLINDNVLDGVRVELQELKAMGMNAVMVQVGFPMLYGPYLASQGQSQASFVNFYQQVAAAVRAQGMKLIVENNILLADDVSAGWPVADFYATLDWTAYQQARAQTALTITRTMQPDYLVVLQEPDMEALNTGQSDVGTASGATTLVSGIISTIQQSSGRHPKLGAGVGTWLWSFQDFISSFVGLPLDFIDMHIYPVNLAFMPRILTIATTAAAAGLPVSISECWLNKVADDELKVLSVEEVRARNPFSFWAPLDAYFIRTMSNLASSTQMAFVSPANSEYYWAYLNYDSSTKNLDPGTILDQENTASADNMNVGSYTSTAMHFNKTLVPRPDTIPPAVPTGFAGNSANPDTAYLTWGGATDDVGVSGYHVLRDGVNVGTTSQLYFQDLGLTEGTTYTYALEAFDLAGNVSPSTLSVEVHTKQVTPPTKPGSLTAAVVSKKQIDISWTASADNAGIRSYLLFQGTSPTALSQVAEMNGASTSHSVYYLTPGTTYYFAVQATDPWGNISPMSDIASATTLP